MLESFQRPVMPHVRLAVPVLHAFMLVRICASIVPASWGGAPMQAHAAGLTILAAFPKAGASPAAQCGTCRTSRTASAGDASACGHMYLDGGENTVAGKA